MKIKLSNRFLTAINSAVIEGIIAVNAMGGVWQEIQLADGEKEMRYRLSPFGEFPATIDGVEIIQLVDAEAGKLMAANFGKLSTQLATFGRGIPMYEGHADHPEWRAVNPGCKESAVGRIKTIENEADGIYVKAVANSDGAAMLSGAAPKYSGHSPRWHMLPVAGREGVYRPVLLLSDALTNSPNIAGNSIAMNALGLGKLPVPPAENSPSAEAAAKAESEKQNNDMKLTPEALKALGFAPDATPSETEISAAIVKMLAKDEADETDKVKTTEALTTVNSKILLLETERGKVIDIALGNAIADGRITKADEPKWKTAINTSFGEIDKLANLMPVINTENKVDLSARRGEGAPVEGGIDAINSAVREYGKTQGIDLTTNDGYRTAFAAIQKAKPELFA